MAQESKTDETKLKYEDIINVDAELQKRKTLIETALSPIDETWTVYDTKNEAIKVAYKQMKGSNSYITKGVMKMKGNIDFYFDYQECGYDDAYIDEENDATNNSTELKIRKLIDIDHQIVYNSSKSAFWGISPRDLVYIRSRFKERNYSFNSKEYETVLGGFAYSVDDKHPFNEPVKNGHVRAKIIISGHILSKLKDCKDDSFEVCFCLALDPGGSIPTWIVNKFAPSKGMEVGKFVKHWDKMQQRFEKRKKNGWKKNHEPLFAQHPKLMYIEDKVNAKEDAQKNDE